MVPETLTLLGHHRLHQLVRRSIPLIQQRERSWKLWCALLRQFHRASIFPSGSTGGNPFFIVAGIQSTRYGCIHSPVSRPGYRSSIICRYVSLGAGVRVCRCAGVQSGDNYNYNNLLADFKDFRVWR